MCGPCTHSALGVLSPHRPRSLYPGPLLDCFTVRSVISQAPRTAQRTLCLYPNSHRSKKSPAGEARHRISTWSFSFISFRLRSLAVLGVKRTGPSWLWGPSIVPESPRLQSPRLLQAPRTAQRTLCLHTNNHRSKKSPAGEARLTEAAHGRFRSFYSAFVPSLCLG